MIERFIVTDPHTFSTISIQVMISQEETYLGSKLEKKRDDAEEEAVSAALDDAADAALTFARDGLTAAMNRHNRR